MNECLTIEKRPLIPTCVFFAVSMFACATTETSYQVACTPDVLDARSHLVELLTSSEADDQEWKARVGLSDVDPAGLVLIEDDTICTTLWNVVWDRPPHVGAFAAFFQLGDVYLVTEYPNADPDLGPVSLARAFTAVVNEGFEGQGPILAELLPSAFLACCTTEAPLPTQPASWHNTLHDSR